MGQKMLNLLLILFVFVTLQFETVLSDGDIGPGKWRVSSVQKCDQPHHKIKIEIEKRKINRTHDGFNIRIELEIELTDEYAVYIESCKHVDGGCKPFQVFSDESLCRFAHKYAEGNLRTALEMAGVDPPDFPMAEGCYEINNFIMDYNEMPPKGIYGEFRAVISILEGSEEIGCVQLELEFKEEEEDCDDEE